MPGRWRREEQAELAIDRILDAAGRAFVELGVSQTGMGEIARFAGCSRGTLYRYFKSRHELHLAFVNRAAQRISESVEARSAKRRNPSERLVEGVLAAVGEVRRTPETAVWFAPGESGLGARMSRSSELIEGMAGTFVEKLLGPGGTRRSNRLRARWMVRVIVSLLTVPGEDGAEERELVRRFVAPTLLVADAPRREGIRKS
jgi:AcrR family transcriptional regulator